MKTLLKLSPRFALALGIAAVLVSSCRKEGTPSDELVEAPGQRVSLTVLVEKMYATSDASGDAAITAAYASLNAGELEQLNALRLRKDSFQIAKRMAESSGGRLSASQESLIREQLRKSADRRKEFQQIALNKFGKQFNKLTNDEINQLLAPYEAAGKASAEAACPVESFPFNATIREVRGIGYYGIYSISNAGGDCDFEYRFDGAYNRMYPTNWLTRQCLNAFGNSVSRRYLYPPGGADTGLLLGSLRVFLIVGHEGWVGLEAHWQ